jgi:hypothetical protein
MTGVEIAVGWVCAWLVSKARRVAGRADNEVDRGLDAGMDRLHELVSAKLGQDPALVRAREEVEAGHEELTERTRRRLTDALEDAAEHDTQFGAALQQAAQDLQSKAVAGDGGQAVGGNVSVAADGEHSLATGRDVNIQASQGGVAAGVIHGSVSTPNPTPPGPA